MKISKPSSPPRAGRSGRWPLQTLVDRDGITKSALRILINEAVSAGIGEICIVIAPGDRDAYLRAAADDARPPQVHRTKGSPRLRPRPLSPNPSSAASHFSTW